MISSKKYEGKKHQNSAYFLKSSNFTPSLTHAHRNSKYSWGFSNRLPDVSTFKTFQLSFSKKVGALFLPNYINLYMTLVSPITMKIERLLHDRVPQILLENPNNRYTYLFPCQVYLSLLPLDYGVLKTFFGFRIFSFLSCKQEHSKHAGLHQGPAAPIDKKLHKKFLHPNHCQYFIIHRQWFSTQLPSSRWLQYCWKHTKDGFYLVSVLCQGIVVTHGVWMGGWVVRKKFVRPVSRKP